jgi:hypothetical protein
LVWQLLPASKALFSPYQSVQKNVQGVMVPLLAIKMHYTMIEPLILEFYTSLNEMARNPAAGNKDK